jgi:hypothetical protein
LKDVRTWAASTAAKLAYPSHNLFQMMPPRGIRLGRLSKNPASAPKGEKLKRYRVRAAWMLASGHASFSCTNNTQRPHRIYSNQ